MEQIDYNKEILELRNEVRKLNEKVEKTTYTKSQKKYEHNIHKTLVRIPDKEIELWEHLKSQPNMNGYLKDLIRQDMNKESFDWMYNEYYDLK